MRNAARVLAFDVAAPAAAVGALLMIGVMLGWPLWWVSVCSILCFLIVQASILNIVLYRRDAVTMGTDDDTPGLRLAVVGLTTAALAVAAAVFIHLVDEDAQVGGVECMAIGGGNTDRLAFDNGPSLTGQADLRAMQRALQVPAEHDGGDDLAAFFVEVAEAHELHAFIEGPFFLRLHLDL